jgi:hypothetical protein
MGLNKTFVCLEGIVEHPGPLCGLGEITFLGVLFFLAAAVGTLLLIRSIRGAKAFDERFIQVIAFWFFIIILQLYRGLFLLVPFHWEPTTFAIWGMTVKSILIFIPMCLVIMILFDLLFRYRDPGSNAVVFFRVLFFLFLVTFIVSGVTLNATRVDSIYESPLPLWSGATDFVLALFFVLPARKLMERVTYPMVQESDVPCVNFCRVGIVVYVLLFVGRGIWGITDYFGRNELIKLARDRPATDAVPRVINFFYCLIFDWVVDFFAMIAVFLLREHNAQFEDGLVYTAVVR